MQQDLFSQNRRVVKSNRLILSRMDWSALEQRIVAIMIAQLNVDTDTFDLQKVHVRDLAKLTGKGGGSLYEQMKRVCESLTDEKLRVRDDTSTGNRSYTAINVMSSCTYKEGQGVIEARFTEDMRPFLIQLKECFTQYRLLNLVRLPSKYSMRVYELLKMREGLRFLRISVEELRETVGCEYQYERFADFRRWVIERSRKDLKEHTDIHFTYNVERGKWNRAERVNFHIRPASSPDREHLPAIESQKSSKGTDVGVEAGFKRIEPSDSTSQGPHLNVYAMVCQDLSQEQLDEISDADLRQIVAEEKAAVDRESNAGATNRAVEAYRKVRQRLETAK